MDFIGLTYHVRLQYNNTENEIRRVKKEEDGWVKSVNQEWFLVRLKDWKCLKDVDCFIVNKKLTYIEVLGLKLSIFPRVYRLLVLVKRVSISPEGHNYSLLSQGFLVVYWGDLSSTEVDYKIVTT